VGRVRIGLQISAKEGFTSETGVNPKAPSQTAKQGGVFVIRHLINPLIKAFKKI
jgi:hypothetical protein